MRISAVNNREVEEALAMPGGLKLIEALKARLGWKANLGSASTYLKTIEMNKVDDNYRQLSLIESEDV